MLERSIGSAVTGFYAYIYIYIYHLPKKDHCHPKARGDKFFNYRILPTFYDIYLHATYNADLEETERPTSRGAGEKRG